jgi:hypothetical protein
LDAYCRVGLAQLVRFIMVKLIHPDLNSRFVIVQLIILSVRSNVSVDSEILLLTDFINLKIKSSQSFKVAHRNKIYIYVFI